METLGQDRRDPRGCTGGTFALVRKIMSLPLGDTVPGSTPWTAECSGIGSTSLSAGDLVQSVTYTTAEINPAAAS